MEPNTRTRPTLDDELDLVPEVEYARITNKKIGSVRNERSQGRGPPFVKLGSKTWYPRKALIAYIAAHTVTPKAEPTLVDGPRHRSARHQPRRR